MSIKNTTGVAATSAEPGHVAHVSGDLSRAREATSEAQLALQLEERRLAGARNRSARTVAEHERRIEDARRDLDAAEAFEEALANGDL